MSSVNPILYSSGWAVTTVSMTVVRRYAPKTFYTATATLTLVNVVYFDKALLTTNNPEKLKKWIAVSCLVMSATLSSILVNSFILVPTLVKTRDLGKLFLISGAMMTLTGTLVPLIRSFYRKGLLDWKQIDSFVKQDRSKLSRGPIQTTYRQVALLFPSASQHLGPSVQPETLSLLPDPKREILWKKEFELLLELEPFLETTELNLARKTCARKLEFLSAESQIRLIEEIHKFPDPSLLKLHPEYTEHVENKKEELGLNLESKLSEIKTKRDFDALLKQVRLYLPTETETLLKFQKETLIPQLNENEKKNSIKNADQDQIDLDDSPANFFLTRSKELGYSKLVKLLGAENFTDLDQKLEERQIGTMGDFITHVLKGDSTLLKNLKPAPTSEKYNENYEISSEVFDKLKNYLQNSITLREKAYSVIASFEPASLSLREKSVSCFAYRAMILIMTLAPVIQNPELSLYGLTLAGLYQLKWVHWLVEQSGINPNLVRSYGFYFSVAARRPVIPQIRLLETPELKQFLKSDIFGKLTIIGLELMITSTLLRPVSPIIGLPPIRIGSLIQGFAIGQEVF